MLTPSRTLVPTFWCSCSRSRDFIVKGLEIRSMRSMQLISLLSYIGTDTRLESPLLRTVYETT